MFDFLKKHADRAWFSNEIAKALKEKGVRACDVMSNVRRFEKRGLVYVRGYKLDDRQTPFKEGFLITWISARAITVKEMKTPNTRKRARGQTLARWICRNAKNVYS